MLILVTERLGGCGTAKGSMRPSRKGQKPAAGDVFPPAAAMASLENSLMQVKLGKREKKKIIEAHLKFYTLMFIYVVFLEGATWTAEGHCKNTNKTQRCYTTKVRDLILLIIVSSRYV